MLLIYSVNFATHALEDVYIQSNSSIMKKNVTLILHLAFKWRILNYYALKGS